MRALATSLLHRQHFPFGGLKPALSIRARIGRNRLHRQHFPFGGLKLDVVEYPIVYPCVAPSALPLRGTET